MEKITFYTDGACSGNPGPGGFGVCSVSEIDIMQMNPAGNKVAAKTSMVRYYKQLCEDTTNNREELKAILKVFQLSQTPEYKGVELVIYSDSAYAVNMINSWIHSWSRNNWKNSKKKEVENLDLVKEIYKYLNIDFFNCQVLKCGGHSGVLGNELADALSSNSDVRFKKLISQNNITIVQEIR